jgi:hypothetical protein
MRTLLIGALVATLLGCSCPLPPQAGLESCIDANGFACLSRTAASQPIEPKPASFKTDSAEIEIKSTIAKTERPSSAHLPDRVGPARKTARPTTIAAKVEPPAPRIPPPPRSLQTRPQPASNAAAAADSDAARASIADSHPTGSAVANSNTGTIGEQVAAATAVAEQMTVATEVPAPEPKANTRDRSNHSETVLRGDAERSPPASAYNTDLLVALLMAGPGIKAVSDLTGQTIAIDDRYSASSGTVRTAIAAAGAAEVQLSEGQAHAIDRLISGEVPAAVLTLVSTEAAEHFPEIAGFQIFRIPLSPRSLKGRRDAP